MSQTFDAWSFLRDVLHRGATVERSADAAGWGYERLSAALDGAAREMAERLNPHLAGQAKWYPIQDGPSVPWTYMAPHESQAQRNHGQTLTRLAERGGLGAAEAELIVSAQSHSPLLGERDWAELKRRWVERAERVNNAYLAKQSKLESLVEHYLSKGREAEARGESRRAASYRSVANMLGVLLQGGEPIGVDFLARFPEGQ